MHHQTYVVLVKRFILHSPEGPQLIDYVRTFSTRVIGQVHFFNECAGPQPDLIPRSK